MTEEPNAGLGLKLMPTPAGTLEGPKLTGPEKPLTGLIVTCDELLLPCTTVKEAWLSEIEKSFTVKDACATWDTFVFCPVTMGVKVPTGVAPLVDIVKTEKVSGLAGVPVVH